MELLTDVELDNATQKIITAHANTSASVLAALSELNNRLGDLQAALEATAKTVVPEPSVVVVEVEAIEKTEQPVEPTVEQEPEIVPRETIDLPPAPEPEPTPSPRPEKSTKGKTQWI